MQMVEKSTEFPQPARILLLMRVSHLVMPIDIACKKVLSVAQGLAIKIGTVIAALLYAIPFTDCLENKTEHYHNCTVLRATIVCCDMHTCTCDQFSQVTTMLVWGFLLAC